MTESEDHGRGTPSAHQSRLQGTRGACLPVAAQELTVAAIHDGDGIPDEADGLAADGGCFPGIPGNLLGAIEGAGNLTIARALEATVKGSHHLDETPTLARRDPPRPWERAGRAAYEATLETQEPGDAKEHILVEGDERRQRVS